MFLEGIFKKLFRLASENYIEILIIIGSIFVIFLVYLYFARYQIKDNKKYFKLIISFFAIALIMFGLGIFLVEKKIPTINIVLIEIITLDVFLALAVFALSGEKKEAHKITIQDISILGLMAGLAFALRFFGFPIFVGSFSFLKLEFSGIIYIIVLLWYGFRSAVLVSLVTNILRVILQVSLFQVTVIFGVDQLLNFISSLAYLVPAAILFYRYDRSQEPNGIKLLIANIIGAVFATVFMVLWNYFVNLPYIYNMSLPFKDVLIYFGSFNLIKWGSVTILIALLWKKFYNLRGNINT